MEYYYFFYRINVGLFRENSQLTTIEKGRPLQKLETNVMNLLPDTSYMGQ